MLLLGHRRTPINQVPKDEFRKRFEEGPAGRWATVVDRDSDVIAIGLIDRDSIVKAIPAFAREVKRIKKAVRPTMKSSG